MKKKWYVLVGSRSFGKAFPGHLESLRKAGCVVHPNSVGRAYREEELLEVLPSFLHSLDVFLELPCVYGSEHQIPSFLNMSAVSSQTMR